MTEPPLTNTESRLTFTFPPAAAIDGDAWMASPDVPSCDFVWRRTRKGVDWVELIEAKSSSPRPANGRNLAHYRAELEQKLTDTVTYYLCALSGRLPRSQLPAELTSNAPETSRWRFVLVVPDHEDAWLPPLRDAVRKATRRTTKTAGLSDPIVLNRRRALKLGLPVT